MRKKTLHCIIQNSNLEKNVVEQYMQFDSNSFDNVSVDVMTSLLFHYLWRGNYTLSCFLLISKIVVTPQDQFCSMWSKLWKKETFIRDPELPFHSQFHSWYGFCLMEKSFESDVNVCPKKVLSFTEIGLYCTDANHKTIGLKIHSFFELDYFSREKQKAYCM